MSTYVKEKVLRVPFDKIDLSYIKSKISTEDWEDDPLGAVQEVLSDLFGHDCLRKFHIAPTEDPFIDYVLESEFDADGEYGKTRALYETEAQKYKTVFQKIDPNIDMSNVRLVEFCWYNGTDAPSYYAEENDPFYDEI